MFKLGRHRLEPMDILLVNIEPAAEDGGIVVPRIPETEQELSDMMFLILGEKWELVGVVPHKKYLKSVKWIKEY